MASTSVIQAMLSSTIVMLIVVMTMLRSCREFRRAPHHNLVPPIFSSRTATLSMDMAYRSVAAPRVVFMILRRRILHSMARPMVCVLSQIELLAARYTMSPIVPHNDWRENTVALHWLLSQYPIVGYASTHHQHHALLSQHYGQQSGGDRSQYRRHHRWCS